MSLPERLVDWWECSAWFSFRLVLFIILDGPQHRAAAWVLLQSLAHYLYFILLQLFYNCLALDCLDYTLLLECPHLLLSCLVEGENGSVCDAAEVVEVRVVFYLLYVFVYKNENGWDFVVFLFGRLLFGGIFAFFLGCSGGYFGICSIYSGIFLLSGIYLLFSWIWMLFYWFY